MRENIPTATERGLRATRVRDIFMNFDKDLKSLQESEVQYGSCAQSELMQSLDASASQLTADDVEYREKMEQCRIMRDKYYAPKEFIFKVKDIPTTMLSAANSAKPELNPVSTLKVTNGSLFLKWCQTDKA